MLYTRSTLLLKKKGLKIDKNIDFSKILGTALPGGQNVPASLESILTLSRGPQLPYTNKVGSFDFFAKNMFE